MTPLCISLPIDRPQRTKAAQAHFKEAGLDGVRIVPGIDAEFAGLRTVHPYELDDPGSGFNMGPKPVGILLGHLMAWRVSLFIPDDVFLFLEDDCRFLPGWQRRFTQAFDDVPADWDVLFLGSCDAANKPRTLIRGEVYDLRYPQCLHCYAVRAKAIPYMLATQRKIYGPLDCTLIFHTWPALKVFTLFPRLAVQENTEISE